MTCALRPSSGVTCAQVVELLASPCNSTTTGPADSGLQVGDVLAVHADLPLRNRHRRRCAAAGSASGCLA
jgi:hypothetical protein